MERLLHLSDEELARKVARSTLITRVFILVAILVGGAVLAVSLGVAADTNTVVTGIEAQQDSNTKVVNSIDDLARTINSCTNPKGKCAQRGQRQTATAIGNIKTDTRDVVAASLACQLRGVTGFEAITACVDRLLLTTAAPPAQRRH